MYYLLGHRRAEPDKLRQLAAYDAWQSAAHREIERRAASPLLEMLDDESLHAVASGAVKLEQIVRAVERGLEAGR